MYKQYQNRYKFFVFTLFFGVFTNLLVAQDEPDFVFQELDIRAVPTINTIGSEMSPFFVQDLLFFSAVPKKYSKPKREKNNTAFYTMYSASVNQQGVVISGRKVVTGFGAEMHEGPADYCEKTGELFISLSNTSSPLAQGRKQKVRLQLAIMKFVNGKWQITEEFPYNNKDYNFAHPAISVTGDTLVFSTDIDTMNYGNTDLFMSVRENGKWKQPENLGGYINTPGNELFPTFIKGGFLSFATNGRTLKYGGLDLYYVEFPGLEKVRIFDKGINSEYDDFGLITTKSGKSGYFSSNRRPENKDDIYWFQVVIPQDSIR